MKQCTRCKIFKNLVNFHRQNDRKSGHRSVCKTCRRLENPESARRMRWFTSKYPERKKEANARYRARHIEKLRLRDKIGHALRKSTRHFGGDVWRGILSKFNDRCARCGIQMGIDLTVDHILPVSKGGPTYSANLQPLCKSCNSKKGVNFLPYELLHHESHPGLETCVI